MKTLVMGTTNPAKVSQIYGVLAPIGIQVEGVADKGSLPDVAEDGTTPVANAQKKAVAFARALGRPVLSMDNALFLHGLAAEDQPGMHLRRFGGKERASDKELLAHGVALVQSLGGRADGYWEFGVCIADPSGRTLATTIKASRSFTATASSVVIAGYPLESIQLDPESGKCISEMTEEEQATFWTKSIGRPLRDFVESAKHFI